MAEDKSDPFSGTQVGNPVPGKETFDRHDDILAIGRHHLQQGVWAGLQVVMHHDVAALVQDANVQAPGVQVDATIQLVRLGVDSPEVSSSSFVG